MGIRILKFTAYIENALCIYRNICLFGVYVRALIITRIVVQLLIMLTHTIVRTNHYYYHPECKTDVLYFYLTSFNSVAQIIFACCYTECYKTLTIHLNSGCKYFDNDKNYVKNLSLQHTVFVSLLFVFCLAKVLIFIYTQLIAQSHPELLLFWNYVFQINLLMCDFRYIFEFLVLYCFLYVMAEQLKVVTRSIDGENVAENNSITLITEVDKWSVIYKHIRESAKLFNYIFGIQLTVMLATAMFYYIIFLYTMASKSVEGSFSLRESSAYLVTLGLMLFILCLVARAAQLMENSADVLRRRLCKLLVLYRSNDECYRATKALLRMMSTRPIRVHAFGSISVDMTLLPTCVSFFTSYTVVALQFNNVL